MTRVLLVGNGAREHAIALALSKCDVEIVAHMDKKNPGISKLAHTTNINSLSDPTKLPELMGIDYAVIGPEGPLSVGFVDYLERAGIPCVGPNLETARIETSKAFTRRLLDKVYRSANPRYVIARSIDSLKKFENSVGIENIVVKPDGLTGGKGVKIAGEHFHTREELSSYVSNLLMDHGIVVLEEKLAGTEFTIQAFVDGSGLQIMPLVRDYKRAYDNDKGPNTGSMGSYSQENHSLNYLNDTDISTAVEIMQKSIIGIKKTTKLDYIGILYGQFMKTSEGIKVIEYNARFGDPEAMNVLSLLQTPIDTIFQSIIDRSLITPHFDRKATVCVYMVPEGYPGPDTVKDSPISLVPSIDSDIYYASVYDNDGIVYTTGSRSIAILSKGDTIDDARRNAYEDVKKVTGKVRFRSDIAAGVE